MKKFKVGDVVKRTCTQRQSDDFFFHVGEDETSIVIAYRPHSIELDNAKGIWNPEFFELVRPSLLDQIKLAKSYIGNEVSMRDAPRSRITITDFELFTSAKDCPNISTRNVFNNDGVGFVIGVAYESFKISPLENVSGFAPPEPEAMKLNDRYDAYYTVDKVTVNCQTFDADVIIELANRIADLRA